MTKLFLGWVVLAGLVSACSSDVDVGGPRDNGGGANDQQTAGSGGSAGTKTNTGTAGSTSASGGSTAAAGNTNAAGATDQTSQSPETFASGDIPCKLDTDCCVVIDSCKNSAFVVSADDQDAVEALIANEDMSRCTGCIAPFVQVTCENSKCVGTSDDYISSGKTPDSRLAQTHCGTVDTTITPKNTGSMFGCGG